MLSSTILLKELRKAQEEGAELNLYPFSLYSDGTLVHAQNTCTKSKSSEKVTSTLDELLSYEPYQVCDCVTLARLPWSPEKSLWLLCETLAKAARLRMHTRRVQAQIESLSLRPSALTSWISALADVSDKWSMDYDSTTKNTFVQDSFQQAADMIRGPWEGQPWVALGAVLMAADMVNTQPRKYWALVTGGAAEGILEQKDCVLLGTPDKGTSFQEPCTQEQALEIFSDPEKRRRGVLNAWVGMSQTISIRTGTGDLRLILELLRKAGAENVNPNAPVPYGWAVLVHDDDMLIEDAPEATAAHIETARRLWRDGNWDEPESLWSSVMSL